MELRTGSPPLGESQRPAPKFAHPTEEAFAHILDYYGIAWDYEPRTFALHWDDEGNVTEAFSPDFYLPEQNLYVELTTLRPKRNRAVLISLAVPRSPGRSRAR